MATRLPTDLLGRSAQEASRLVVLSRLAEIKRAEHRLADPLETEALHDFRVGLRRLRSCLRAYRPVLKGSVPRKVSRRLRDLTLETNAGRDVEVQLAWLREQAPTVGSGEGEGLGWLIGRLEGRKVELLDRAAAKVARRFLKLESRLRPRLLTFEVAVRSGGGGRHLSFAALSADLIRSQTAELSQALQNAQRTNDMAEAHTTRLRVKRLRYLLEPLSQRVPRLKGYIKRLKELQNVLGELHDMQVMVESMPASTGVATIDPGIYALRRRAEERVSLLLARFHTNWTPARAAGLLSRIDAVADGLEVRSSGEAKLPELPGKGTTGAPDPLAGSAAGTPVPAFSLTTSPLPLPLPQRQQLR